MKRLSLLGLVLILLTGCGRMVETLQPSVTPVPSIQATNTPVASENATATPYRGTAAPSASPVPTPVPTPTPMPGPVENLLLCWGFECGWQYDTRHPTGGLKVPLGWTAFWQGNVPAKWETSPPSDRFCDGFIPAVETEAHPPHVREGWYSGRVIEAGRNCPAGLYQTVSVEAGKSYVFSGYLLNWSTDNPQVGTPSTSYIRSFIGIDPAGGTDWKAASVVWSKEESAHDVFAYMEVEARAQGDHITVFLLSIPNFGVARSDSFWDDFSLIETVAPLPPVVEVTPVWPFADQLGTMVYDTVTNLRLCGDNLWANPFDPTTCPFSTDGFEVVQTMQPGNKAGVIRWGIDRYGNRWARYLTLEDGTAQTSVACYKSLPRGKFYPGVQVSQYDGLAAKGLLPLAKNPCEVQ